MSRQPLQGRTSRFAILPHGFARYAMMTAEIAVLLMLAIGFTSGYQNFDPRMHLSGGEAHNVTASAHFLEFAWQRYGYIPSWQPYSNGGQPLIDEAYSFLLNPFAFFSVLALGGSNGVKLTIILHVVIAGVGGWFLGKSLGMSIVGRMLLGSLLIIKGNMQSIIGQGFLQIGIVQAYFPWVVAGAFGLVRQVEKRWPPVLVAVSLALTFYCGTIYFMLPAVLMVLFIFATYALRLRFQPIPLIISGVMVRRLLMAGLLTAGLIAATAITILINFGLVDGHPDHYEYLTPDLGQVLSQFFTPTFQFSGFSIFAESFYSYVMPLWFVIVLFIALPPFRRLHRLLAFGWERSMWLCVLMMFIFFTLWGISITPIVPWIYEHIPLIGQWRYPERMLTVSAVLLVMLVAMRADSLFRNLWEARESIAIDGIVTKRQIIRRLLAQSAALVLLITATIAVSTAYQQAVRWDDLWPENPDVIACTDWMVANVDEPFLSVRKREFGDMAHLIRNGVRMELIGAAYEVMGVPATLYPHNLYTSEAEYYMATWDQSREFMTSQGYIPLEDSPPVSAEFNTPCLWRNPNALHYAFASPLPIIAASQWPLLKSQTTDVQVTSRTPEVITLGVTPLQDESLVVVAQDIAYPGWTVRLNGEAAHLESVGRLLGVIVPPGDTPVTVQFIYTAPTLKWGGVVTLATIAFTIPYLLRVDGWPLWRQVRQVRRLSASRRANMGRATVSTDAPPAYPVNNGAVDKRIEPYLPTRIDWNGYGVHASNGREDASTPGIAEGTTNLVDDVVFEQISRFVLSLPDDYQRRLAEQLEGVTSAAVALPGDEAFSSDSEGEQN